MKKKWLFLGIILIVLAVLWVVYNVRTMYILSVRKTINLWIPNANKVIIETYNPHKTFVYTDMKQINHFKKYLESAEMRYEGKPCYVRRCLITISNSKLKKTYGLEKDQLCGYDGSWGSTRYFLDFYKTGSGFWRFIKTLDPDIQKSIDRG